MSDSIELKEFEAALSELQPDDIVSSGSTRALIGLSDAEKIVLLKKTVNSQKQGRLTVLLVPDMKTARRLESLSLIHISEPTRPY